MAKKARKKSKINYRALVPKAAVYIKEHQQADYKFLREKLGPVGIGVINEILERLRKKGIVGQGKGRRWLVLVNPDGTKKEDIVLPKRRRRKISRSRGKQAAPAPLAVALKATGHYGLAAKKAVLGELSKLVNKDMAGALAAISDDLDKVATAERVEAAFKAKD